MGMGIGIQVLTLSMVTRQDVPGMAFSELTRFCRQARNIVPAFRWTHLQALWDRWERREYQPYPETNTSQWLSYKEASFRSFHQSHPPQNVDAQDIPHLIHCNVSFFLSCIQGKCITDNAIWVSQSRHVLRSWPIESAEINFGQLCIARIMARRVIESPSQGRNCELPFMVSFPAFGNAHW